MPLQLIVDSLDSVAEAHRALYTEADGKFRLQVDGIEDTKGLKTALDKERQAAREAQQAKRDLEKRFEGIDPDVVKSLMSKFESTEEAELIAAGKMDQVIAKRTEKQRQESERQVKEAQTKAQQAEERADAYSQRVLDNQIRQAASTAGIHSHAIEDALFRGRGMFKLDESGDAVQFGSDGHPVLGKDGKTPFTPKEWLEGMKEKAPHWFPASASGGGANGKPAGQGSKDFSHLPPTERMTAARAAKK